MLHVKHHTCIAPAREKPSTNTTTTTTHTTTHPLHDSKLSPSEPIRKNANLFYKCSQYHLVIGHRRILYGICSA